MRGLRVYAAWLALLAGTHFSGAQTPSAPPSPFTPPAAQLPLPSSRPLQGPAVAPSVIQTNLIVAELQALAARQRMRDQLAYVPHGTINPELLELGVVSHTLVSDPVPAQDLWHFNAKVIHQNGASQWSIGTFVDGRIATSIGARSVAIASRDKLSGVIDALIHAVRAGELDEVIGRAGKPAGAAKPRRAA